MSGYEDYNDVLHQLGRFLDEVTVHKRIHSYQGTLNLAAFEEQWRREQAQVALFTTNHSERIQFSGSTADSWSDLGGAFSRQACATGSRKSFLLPKALA